MLDAWLRNSRSILAFMKKEMKDKKRERDRKENAWRSFEQFFIVFF